MPAGANAKREREYEELASRFRREGRYRGREDEVAARIVNRQRRQYGETKDERRKDREDRSPDRGLPVRDYQRLTIAQAARALDGLSARELRTIRRHEARHKNRKGMLALIDRKIARA